MIDGSRSPKKTVRCVRLNAEDHHADIPAPAHRNGRRNLHGRTLLQDTQLSQISNFIWGVADDYLRDVYVRGKYRDVILPMTVLRRLDAVLEPTKQKVLDEKKWADENNIENPVPLLAEAAGQAFYNTSPFQLLDLTSRGTQQQLRDDFNAYLDGFSPNVQDILEKFEFRNQISRLSTADVLGSIVSRFLSPQVNLSPEPALNADNSVRLPGLDNHAMGTIFEDLVRRFNEENNEEAGEHWTPRDAVELMAQLVFQPIQDQVESGTYLLYDGAIGTGGMLTIAEQTLKKIAAEKSKQVSTHLHGQEINNETYAICKADMLLKEEQNVDDSIIGGPQHSTLSNDAFKSRTFDFMLSNPPYGKSWKGDQDKMGGKSGLKDSRFLIQHGGNAEYSLVTRSSDGQMLFLANMASKMRHDTELGSRIAEVHNGSSLFTGDAGQGESNIRRWIIENDWLEAIVALPLNMFYNTGIATYIWVLTNPEARPPEGEGAAHRRHQVVHAPPEEPGPEELRTIPGRQSADRERLHGLRGCGGIQDLPQRGLRVLEGDGGTAAEAGRGRPQESLQGRGNQEAEGGEGEGRKRCSHRQEGSANRHRGQPTGGQSGRDSEGQNNGRGVRAGHRPAGHRSRVPLLHPGGIEAFLQEEVLPYAPDAWYNPEAVKVGYEINFNRHFYKPQPMRSLEEIRADILALEQETEGLLAGIIG